MHLTDSQRKQIEQRLAEREAELQAEVRAAKGDAEDGDEAGPDVQDMVEVGEERFRRGMEHVDLQRDQEELRAIADARERMLNGSYGECVDCGKTIPFQRLEVQPFALRCIDCQAKWEKTHPTTPVFSV